MSRYQTPYLQYFDAAGKPLAGGKLFFYDAGTNDLKTVFTDIDQTIPATNPVTLNTNGSVSNVFYSGLARVVLQNATGTQIFDIDDVGPEDLSGFPPLYVSDATYSLNDVAKTADGLYYRSTQNMNAGNTPSPSSEYWEKIDFIYTYNANSSYKIDDVAKFGGQLYISTIDANQGNSPATSNNWRKLTVLAEFEYLSGGLTLNKVNYPVGTKAHVKSFSAATGGKYSYWVKQATTGPVSKLPSERLDLQCTDALGAVWSLQHSGTVYISSIGGDEGADNGLVFRAYDQKADYLDLEGKTWPCTSLSTDNGAGREILQSKVFNGKLVVTNGLNGETNVQTFAPFLESEVQLSETKSPIVDWTGLNVLWLGTSIPHQAVGVDGYPERLAEKLNFTVQNWAWSGSHAFYDIDGDAFDSGTVRALSMTEADRLAGLATYGSSSAYDDSFDIVTKASQMTTEYRIKRQFESGAIDCVVLDHNHNDRKNIAGYTANDKTINAVVKGTSTTFTLDDVGGLFEGDGCYVRVEGIDELDYAAGRITGISGSQVTVAIDSSGMAGTFTSGEFKFVDRNTVDGAFDFLIAYTKNMFIRYGNADGKIILCGAPSYFTNDVDRDHAIWSVNRSIKAIADKWGLSFFDVANALRLTYRDHVTYLPDDVHPSTPETRKVFANIWAAWMNGGAGNFYNPEEVLQRNKLIDNENNQPALYSKYDQSFATRDVVYTEDNPLINEDFSGGLGAWTQLGTGTPTVVSAPWGSGDAVQFDVLADNTAPYIRQNAAVGATPVLEFDFYMPNVDVATGTTQQVTIASINAAGGAGYSVGIIQTVGGATQLRATYNQGGYGAAPVVPLPGATLTISDATKYRVKIDVVDGYIFFSVDGNKLYAGALDNSLLGAASSVLVGPTFTNMSSAFSVFIGNVVAGAKTENHVMTTEELQKTVQSYTLAELTSMSPTLTGRRVICSDLGDAPFELAPNGYVVQPGDRVAANGRVWALVINDGILNVLHFGGKEGQDCTDAIEDMFSFAESHPHAQSSAVNGERGIWLLYDGWTMYFPRGLYIYSGSGMDISQQKNWKILGDSPTESIVKITSDAHLFTNTDASSNIVGYIEFNSIKVQGGRGGFFCSKTNVSNVQYGKRVYNSCFVGYTSVAFGSLNFQDARWHIQQSVFEGGDTGTPVGLILPDEVAECDISGNTFGFNKYQVIIRPESSRYNLGPNNFFFNSAVGNREADIWIIPMGTSDFQNAEGFEVVGNRFSNENALNDMTVLIADRDGATADHVFSHSASKSDGWCRGITFKGNKFSRAGTSSEMLNPGVIYSYAYKLGGMTFEDNYVSAYPYVLEFDSSVTDADIDAGQNFLNRFYPKKGNEAANLDGLVDFSNRDGAGLTYSAEESHGYKGEIVGYSSALTDFVNLITTNSCRTIATDGATLSNVTDSEGLTTGTEITWTANNNVYLSTTFQRASSLKGVPAWVEFDIKSASTQSLTAVKVEMRIGQNIASVTVPVTANWKRVQIPFSWADDYTSTGTFEIRMRPSGWLNAGVSDKVQIGRRALYHSSGKVDYEKVRI